MWLLILACSSPADTALSDTALSDTAQDGALHGRMDDVDGQAVLYLWGSRYEMGYAEGALSCDVLGPLFKDYLLEELVGEYTDYDYAFVRGYVLGSVSFQDGDAQELQGMYQGALDHCTEEQLTVQSELLEPGTGGSRLLEYEDLLFANALADFGCSSFSVWGDASATGDTLHARNFDWAVDDEGRFIDNHLIKVYDSIDEGGRFLSVMVPGMIGCVSCVTDEAVALTMHNVAGLPSTDVVGISPRMLGARAALLATMGASDPASAAEAVLEERPQNTGNNLHLAYPVDRGAGDGAVVFEYDGAADHPDGRVTVRRAGEDPDFRRSDAVVATNHYIARQAVTARANSTDRATALRVAIDAQAQLGGLSRGEAQAVLTEVENGSGGLTVHAIVLDSASRQLDLYVAPDVDTPAPEGVPVTIDLDALFDGLP